MVAEVQKNYCKRKKATNVHQNMQPTPSKNLLQHADLQLQISSHVLVSNCDLALELLKIKILVPLLELLQMPDQKQKVARLLDFGEPTETTDDNLKVYLEYAKSEDDPPFFISLVVNDLLLDNCMLAFGAPNNVMPLEVILIGIKDF
jgi:hypothetical protein